MKKTHKVTIKFEDSEKTKIKRSFETEAEANAFIEGITIANQVDGMNGFESEYFETQSKGK